MNKVDSARAWLLSRVGNPYLMGGTGQFCTVAYRKARAAQYPGSAAKIKANCPRMRGAANRCMGCRYYDETAGTGKRAYDCAQLTRWCMDAIGIKLVSGATSQWNKTAWAEKGEISGMPREKMCLVFRQDGAKVMGHVGVYLGDGTVVHAKGHDYGVVREGLEEYGRFTHYGVPMGLYEAQEEGKTDAQGGDAAQTLAISREKLEALRETLATACTRLERWLKEARNGAMD